MIRIGVTGTDTGVGKTYLSTLLLAMLRRKGLNVAAMKPVETGANGDDPASDAARLRAAAGAADALDLVRPVLLSEPLAPWVALSRAGGGGVDVGALDAAFHALSSGRDAILVEGAGGLLVPLTRDLAYDGLFVGWGLDLIVVAGNRRGTLNHTMLTVRAAHDAGLRVRGVILNALGPDRNGIAERTNLEALTDLLEPVPVVHFPWIRKDRPLEYALEIAEENGFDRLIADRVAPSLTPEPEAA
ncbi:dethiobiotin synthase [Longimicrobium sp.]|uniref:dethiobiotin synthase n=1 Tax=Longimicrobium sp. TaxID=2029185 RepID=UPI003B3B5A31